MKRRGQGLLALACVLLMAFLLQAAPVGFAAQTDAAEPVCYNHGDVNGDGSIDGRDAIYTLYSVLNPEGYPIDQDRDFNGDGEVNNKDAIWLLYASFGVLENYQLEGEIHSYYAPRWNWQADGTVDVQFQCACGQTQTFEDVELTETTTEAACTVPGKIETVAAITFEGVEYTSAKTETIPAAGHQLNGVQTCTEGVSCAHCDYALEPLGHDWILDEKQSVAATCSENALQVYTCRHEGCGETREVELEGLASHAYEFVEEIQVEGCTYQKTYRCSVCAEESAGETFAKHTYTVSLTKEATCSSEGEKTYTCACGDSYTESVAKNDSHSWVAGAAENGVTTYSCGCGATKSAVVSNENSATVSSETLAEAEVQLQGAALKLDDATLAQLGEEVSIEVNTVSVSEITLDAASAAQIGSNPVYDFAMTSGEEAVSQFDGQVTISLPYELQSGDDVDCIDVWFISDDGSVTCVQGSYSNGYVTFTTDHFSYYTVTRLTAQQRCQQYGHAMVDRSVAPTCTANGQAVELCQRCGYERKNEVVAMINHSYELTETAATCTEDGSFTKTCSVCRQSISGTLPALGHDWMLDEEQSAAASCSAAGKEVYICTHESCELSYEVELPQLEHTYEIIDEGGADCTNRAYVTRKCTICGDTYTEDLAGATGHDYSQETAQWQWAEDYSSATVTLVCSFDESHTKTLNAVVTRKNEAASCTESGLVTFTATASFNMKTYTDSKSAELAVVGHTPDETWHTNKNQHFHLCQTCGEKVDTTAHGMSNFTVVKDPTCRTGGQATMECKICGYVEKVAISATGKHTFVNGVCSDCSFKKADCTHTRTYAEPIDLSGYSICSGAVLTWRYCDCGESRSINYENLSCSFGEAVTREETLEDGTKYEVTIRKCTKCGFVIEQAGYPELDPDTCYTKYTQYQKFLQGDQVIAESNYISSQGYHFTRLSDETVNLADYGMCGGTLEVWSCSCGERKECYSAANACNWVYNEEDSGKEKDVAACAKCGTVRTEVYGEKKLDNCQKAYEVTVTFTRDGEVLYSYSNGNTWIEHDYQVSAYTLDGDSCEDGVSITQVCKDCGKVYERYSNDHWIVFYTDTDVGSLGMCFETFRQAECACGECGECYLINEADDGCDFTYMWDEETNSEIAVCEDCGFSRQNEYSVSQKDENCYALERDVYTYKDATGKVVATGENRWKMVFHNMDTQVELMGETCEDGAKVRQECRDCGEIVEQTVYKHESFVLESYDLTEYGMCSGILQIEGCACGDSRYNYYEGGCNWEWHDGDEYMHCYYCPECDTYREVTDSIPETTGQCRVTQTRTIRIYRDNKTLLETSFDGNYEDHRYVYTFPEIDNCDNGGTANGVCLDCGNEIEDRFRDHVGYPIAREKHTLEQLCGDMETIVYQCGCGEESHVQIEWRNGACTYGEEYYMENDTWARDCLVCGVTKIESNTYETSSDSCEATATRNYTFRKNGVNLLTFDVSYGYKEHYYLYSFTMLGETCEDGYYVTRTCADCGFTYEEDWTHTGCGNWRTAREVLYSGEDTCSDIVATTHRCPCGDDFYIDLETECSFDRLGYDEEMKADAYVCTECGLKQYANNTSQQRSGSCLVDRTLDYRYYLDGEEIASYQKEYTTREHKYVYTFEMLGESCEDGYYVNGQCTYCDKVIRGDYRHTSHETFCTEYYDLTRFGLCGGYINVYSCGCGDYASANYNSWSAAGECSWYSTGKTDAETGLEEYYCAECNTYRYVGGVMTLDKTECKNKGSYTVKLVRDGETLLNKTWAESEEAHIYVVDSVAMNVEGGTCEQGYTVVMKCVNCGDSYTRTRSSHSTMLWEYLDLNEVSDSSCGGEFRYYRCACGQESYLNRNTSDHNLTTKSWNEEGTDGYTHNFNSYTCADCGFRMIREWYYVEDVANCKEVEHEIYTVSMDGEEIASYHTQDVYSNHTYGETTYTLLSGSESCEDGVLGTRTCTVCGNVYTFTTTGHELTAVETVDLEPYGSVCGAGLSLYRCACGQRQRYDFSEQTQCDMDRQWISNWVEGTIDTWQETSEGEVYTYSDSYLFVCAVTDPACALKIRMSEYWLAEDCWATEYQTWQLGYDDETGTCQKEITIPTGYAHAFHNYENTSIADTLEDGTVISGTLQTCVDCQSTYYWKDYSLDGTQVKYEEEALNTKDNGERKRRYRVYEYGFEHAGYRYMTLDRYVYVEADGTETWDQWDYTYDFTDGCRRTVTETRSDGYQHTYVSDAHKTEWSIETLKEKTCSQYGTYVERWICQVCGEITSEYYGKRTPYAHSWRYDSAKEIYVCNYCGLESINGASGVVVIEDMTEAYGEGENYVVGYWNRENVAFTAYASVVLNDVAEDENDEIVLSGIAFTELTAEEDGITAYTFSQSAAQEAAKAAVDAAGYSGSYAIRFTFVPVNSEDTLDYAITFDSVTE